MDTIETIISLMIADTGAGDISPARREEIHHLWTGLDQTGKEFLSGLTSEDLENVCIGEIREAEDGESLWLFNGSWQKLPRNVDFFLEEIHGLVE